MLEIKGDIFKIANQENPDAICCTINQVVKQDGKLVMGAGIAKQFAAKWPLLPEKWGKRIKSRPYVLVSNGYPCLVGFPTKIDWKNDSPIWLIERSAKQLVIIAEALNWKQILMTRPGCGFGGLDWNKEVKPVLQTIFDERFVVVNND